jgi:hypothetical protein
VDVGRHALMRGLATACPIFVRGWSLSYDGHQREAGLQALLGSSPPWGPSPALHYSRVSNDPLSQMQMENYDFLIMQPHLAMDAAR